LSARGTSTLRKLELSFWDKLALSPSSPVVRPIESPKEDEDRDKVLDRLSLLADLVMPLRSLELSVIRSRPTLFLNRLARRRLMRLQGVLLTRALACIMLFTCKYRPPHHDHHLRLMQSGGISIGEGGVWQAVVSRCHPTTSKA
jgi:hypothetical protein